MLIEFTVGNYRSFKDKMTLSMLAANISSRPEELDTQNMFKAGRGHTLLKSAAIYGANASGKSNLVKALQFFRIFVLTSSRESQATEHIPVEAFRLNTETAGQPSFFEAVFLIEDNQYRYGFAVTDERVIAEWLWQLGKAREKRLFERDAQKIEVTTSNFKEGKALAERTRPNALFLSVVAQFNGSIATSILRWLTRLVVNTGVDDRIELLQAINTFEESAYRPEIEQLLRRFDIGIEGFAVEHLPLAMPKNLPKELTQLIENMQASANPTQQSIQTFHSRYNAQGKVEDQIAFDLQEHESAGTQRLFALAAPLLRTLRNGTILVVDEFDARVHPNLVVELIRLFNSSTTNPNGAQLIFTTHNTNLLSASLFRRDQIWFAEKTRRGASDLYSLVEYRTPDGKIIRNDASFEKDYILGRYGAIPFIGSIDELFGDGIEQTSEQGR